MSSLSDSIAVCMLRDLTSWKKYSTVSTCTHAQTTLAVACLLKDSSGSNFGIIAVDVQLSSVCSCPLQVMNGYCKDMLWQEALPISPSLSPSPAPSPLDRRPLTPHWPSVLGSTVASQREEPAWWRLCHSYNLYTLTPLAKKAPYLWCWHTSSKAHSLLQTFYGGCGNSVCTGTTCSELILLHMLMFKWKLTCLHA